MPPCAFLSCLFFFKSGYRLTWLVFTHLGPGLEVNNNNRALRLQLASNKNNGSHLARTPSIPTVPLRTCQAHSQFSPFTFFILFCNKKARAGQRTACCALWEREGAFGGLIGTPTSPFERDQKNRWFPYALRARGLSQINRALCIIHYTLLNEKEAARQPLFLYFNSARLKTTHGHRPCERTRKAVPNQRPWLHPIHTQKNALLHEADLKCTYARLRCRPPATRGGGLWRRRSCSVITRGNEISCNYPAITHAAFCCWVIRRLYWEPLPAAPFERTINRRWRTRIEGNKVIKLINIGITYSHFCAVRKAKSAFVHEHNKKW